MSNTTPGHSQKNLRPAAATARKRQVLPAEVRIDDLMAAAARLFIAKGIDATTINDIVESANVGKGTFYHYFSSKNDVILALRDRFSQECKDAVQNAIAQHPPDAHRQRFATWLYKIIDYYIANYRLHDVVFHEFRHSDRNSLDRALVIGQLQQVLSAGTRDGVWNIADTHTTAIVIYSAMHGVVDDAIASSNAKGEGCTAKAIYQQLVPILESVLPAAANAVSANSATGSATAEATINIGNT